MAERLVFKPECGCEVFRIMHSKPNLYRIQYCPKHNACEDMYEALKTTIVHPQSVAVDTLSEAQCRAELKRVCDRIDHFKDIANQALSKAEGK